MKTLYSKLATSYRLSMKLTGFARCLQHYVRRLPIQLPLNAKILDAGCGTGILGISMKKFFPRSIILATDFEEKFFINIQKRIVRYNFPGSEFNVGIADISSPENVLLIDKQSNLFLNPETFDCVIVGAALGYSVDSKQSIIRLLKLIKIGGYFIDIEMSENIIGKTLSNIFKYRNPGIINVIKILNENGCVVKKIPFSLIELLAGLSRTGIIAQKISV